MTPSARIDEGAPDILSRSADVALDDTSPTRLADEVDPNLTHLEPH
jgi:hypothetical protein